MSRHLRTHGDESRHASTTSNQQHIPLPIFTDTPVTQVPTSSDGCKALSTTSVQSCLLVARALLRSEPFSTWGLRITFFEEYCWAAWIRLEADLAKQMQAEVYAEKHQIVGMQHQKSRLGRHLPPAHLTPGPICDFSGVDGSKKNLLLLDDEEKKMLKLDEKRSRSLQEGRSPGHWPEKLPRTLTVKAMGGTWDSLERAPMAANLNPVDGQAEYPRMKLNDEDQGIISWQRYLDFLKQQDLTIESVKTKSNNHLSRSCHLCKDSIQLHQHLTYTTCPSPFVQLQPKYCSKDSPNALAQFGFLASSRGRKDSSSNISMQTHCNSLFHIQCLASHFTRNQSNNLDSCYVLPTHGFCPACGLEGMDEHSNTWIEIIRAVYRRKEYLEKEILREEAIRIREERLAAKKRPTAKKSKASCKGQESDKENISPDSEQLHPKRDGLLGALDQVQGKRRGKRSFQPVSTLLRDPIQSPPPSPLPSSIPAQKAISEIVIETPAKRSSLLCNLDSLLNAPLHSSHTATHSLGTKRAKSAASKIRQVSEIIDLT